MFSVSEKSFGILEDDEIQDAQITE